MPVPAGPDRSILIVDDEEGACITLRALLSDLGACTVRREGEEAVEACRQKLDNGEHFDLIVMDIMMPGMDGITALTAIRAMEEERRLTPREQARVVMLSSTTDPTAPLRSYYRAGANCFLPKPIDFRTLEEALRNIGFLD
ncbi:MAG: response regulator [Desulfovibrionaceae bacterium]